MTKEELRELVTEMRALGVTKFQDGALSLELAPAPPAPPPEPDPQRPDYTATLMNQTKMKNLEMLFKHSSKKPFRGHNEK